MKLKGLTAIRWARRQGMLLSKYNDPTEGELFDLTPDQAENIARDDQNLIYLNLDDFDGEEYNYEMWMIHRPENCTWPENPE